MPLVKYGKRFFYNIFQGRKNGIVMVNDPEFQKFTGIIIGNKIVCLPF